MNQKLSLIIANVQSPSTLFKSLTHLKEEWKELGGIYITSSLSENVFKNKLHMLREWAPTLTIKCFCDQDLAIALNLCLEQIKSPYFLKLNENQYVNNVSAINQFVQRHHSKLEEFLVLFPQEESGTDLREMKQSEIDSLLMKENIQPLIWSVKQVKQAGGWSTRDQFPFPPLIDHHLIRRGSSLANIGFMNAAPFYIQELLRPGYVNQIHLDWEAIYPHFMGAPTRFSILQETPKISILMSVYNEERYIQWSLSTALKQIDIPFEVVVIDDCSTDQTFNILREWEEKDSRLKVIRMNRNVGKAKAMNEGLKHCSGEYIFELDADDWLDRDALRKSVEIFEQVDQKIACIYGDRRVWTELSDGNLDYQSVIHGEQVSSIHDYIKKMIPYGPRVYRRTALEDVGGWPWQYPSEGRLYEDVALLIRLLQKYQLHYQPAFKVYNIRARLSSISRNNRDRWESIGSYFKDNFMKL